MQSFSDQKCLSLIWNVDECKPLNAGCHWTALTQTAIYRYRPHISVGEVKTSKRRFKCYHSVKDAEVYDTLMNFTIYGRE